MESKAQKIEIVKQLQEQILKMQGFKSPSATHSEKLNLGILETCFPNHVFPVGTLHEFIGLNRESCASSEGFIAILMANLMKNGRMCIWISRNRKLFPPALENFGVNAQRVIFIDLDREKEILWVMEEALKHEGLAVVIAELPEIDFAQSRRLQLAIEKSKVTGIILRREPKRQSATACTVRWQIIPQPSILENNLPGVGFPQWEIQLLKVKNGHTGHFLAQWCNNRLIINQTNTPSELILTKQTG